MSIFSLLRSPEPTSWQLVLICEDGLPEVQGYDTESLARSAGRKQLGTGDGDYRVVRYYVHPITTNGLLAIMRESGQALLARR